MQNIPKTDQPAERPCVAICVATFQRPQLLQNLLDAFAQLKFNKVSEPSVRIIVADNDEAQSAKPVCQGARIPWPVRYVCEPQRGIARARNRAIECAGQADFLAFIDDDEVPSVHWLDELLWVRSRYKADVVSGSVIPAFAKDVPKWIRDGKFFHRPVFNTGHPLRLCSTNNALIRAKILRGVPGFDERFNFTGGEDTLFFLRVREAGFRMVFSKEAVVYEPVSAQRANFSWLLRRGFQAGNSWAHCEKSMHPERSVTALRIFKEIFHIARGALEFLASPIMGKAQLLRSLQTMIAGVGTLAGMAGYRFLPYRNNGETGKPSVAHATKF